RTLPLHGILAGMNTEGSATSSTGTKAPPGMPAIDPITLFSLLRNPIRLKLLKLLADGRLLTASEAASLLHRDIDIIINHLGLLKSAGLLEWKADEDDARFLHYYLRAVFRPEANLLNFGFCTIQLSGIPDYSVR